RKAAAITHRARLLSMPITANTKEAITVCQPISNPAKRLQNFDINKSSKAAIPSPVHKLLTPGSARRALIFIRKLHRRAARRNPGQSIGVGDPGLPGQD
ncbi:MAG: hypothetical protein K6U74_17020, partial [Firmicutes bacterium]|nr:hypothetical protein [Bacillota bacterium]